MHKKSIFNFLLPVLLALVLNSGCNATGITKLNFDFHPSAIYSMPACDQLPVLISPYYSCAATAINPGIAFRNCLHPNGIQDALMRCTLFPPGFSGTAGEFSQLEKYLRGIYPSHHFW